MACGSFALLKAGDKSGDLEVEQPYGLEGVFERLRELPEQIKVHSDFVWAMIA
jgi:hypothetical protein